MRSSPQHSLPSDPVRVAERVLQLLETGSFTATYKQAVLVALLDLCLEQTHLHDGPRESVTTRQLAEKVIELYWIQTRPWSSDDGFVLSQSSSGRAGTGRAKIVRLIRAFREMAEAGGRSASMHPSRLAHPDAFERLLREVEWVLIEMPLPKLQRVGTQDTGWLYEISWDDSDNAPTRSQIRRYQNGATEAFDNLIRFQPGVPAAFVSLHGILRPFILQHWSAKVATLNHLDEARLPAFLFGVDRRTLNRVRAPLHDLQRGNCFYCRAPVSRAGCEVDHFIPWARHPDDGLHNLAVAHKACNNSKRDFLASARHLEAWRARSLDRARELADIAELKRWDLGDDRIFGVARSIYFQIPEETRLWASRSAFVIPDQSRIRALLDPIE